MPSWAPTAAIAAARSAAGLGVACEHDVSGQQDLGRVAVKVLAVLMQDVAFSSELLGRAAHEVPVLSKPSRSAQQRPFSFTATLRMQIGGAGTLNLAWARYGPRVTWW